MNIKDETSKLGLTPNNTIVIGSGILSALGLRASKDIDLVVTEEKYKELFADNRFKEVENHGRDILADDLFEIGTDWTVIGKTWKFEELLQHSIVIDEIRYNSIEFLLNAKKSWLANGDIRQKDIDDVELMENYLRKAD